MSTIRPSTRTLAVAVLLVAPLWAVAWAFSAQADGSLATVHGLSEGAWRAVLNPALLVLVAAVGRWALLAPTPSSLVTLAGVTLVLLGNVLEFGLGGRPIPSAGLGQLVFVLGAVLALVGMGLTLGVAAHAASGRRRVGIGAGISSAVAVGVMVLAAPAAAAIAVFPLVDSLWRAPASEPAGLREPATAGSVAPA